MTRPEHPAASAVTGRSRVVIKPKRASAVDAVLALRLLIVALAMSGVLANVSLWILRRRSKRHAR